MEAIRILIVEDSEDLQDLLGQLFKREGYDLMQAYNGQEALNLLSSMPTLPSLILLDIMMPVMDGIEFRSQQKKDLRLSAIPVVVMSADSNAKAKALQMEIDNLVLKPIRDINKLLELVEKVSA